MRHYGKGKCLPLC